LWVNEKLEIAMQFLCNHDIDLIYHRLKIKRQKFSFFKRKEIYTKKLGDSVTSNLLILGNVIGNSSVVVRRDLLNAVNFISEDKNMVASEDYNCWLKISEITNKFFYVNKILGYYYLHENNSSNRDMSSSYLCAVNKYIKGSSEKIKKIIIGRSYLMKAEYYYSNENFIEAIKFYRRSYENLKYFQKLKITLKIFICMVMSIKS
jgi:hypothetical protein